MPCRCSCNCLLTNALAALTLLFLLLGGGCNHPSTTALHPITRTTIVAADSAAQAWLGSVGQDSRSVRLLVKQRFDKGSAGALRMHYPLAGALFPPEITAPTFRWSDSSGASCWLLSFTHARRGVIAAVLSGGTLAPAAIDERCRSEANSLVDTSWIATARGWRPSAQLWEQLKAVGQGDSLVVMVEGVRLDRRVLGVVSRGRSVFGVSTDSVGTALFYRDVPLMPSQTLQGEVKPLADNALPLIQWCVRDISQDSTRVVLKDMPTCANCHSFSRDGSTLGMDMDGPQGDKGAYALVRTAPTTTIQQRDLFSWNRPPRKTQTFGLFSRVSPDGHCVASAVDEEVFVANYTDFTFLQSFYPTRGKLAIYNRDKGTIATLAGADDERYVQCNPVWSPDGGELVFLRAPARSSVVTASSPTHAGHPAEPQLCYDLYRIPFNQGSGGRAEPVAGASRNGASNSFPVFSPDGKWIVFVKSRNGLLMRPDSRLWIVAAQGGEARELGCNLGRMNSWHSFSPNSRWMVFASKAFSPFTQMFLTHVDSQGIASVPVLIEQATAANRAVNLPEFAPGDAAALLSIKTPAVDYRRHLDRARDLVVAGKYNEALKEAQASLHLRSDYGQTWSMLSFILDETGKTDEAIAHYRRAIGQNPAEMFNYVNLSALLNGGRQFSEAQRVCIQAAVHNRCHGPLLYNWGIALEGLKQPAQAIEKLLQASNCEPSLGAALYRVGHILLEQGLANRALPFYIRACKADSTLSGAWLSAGKLLCDGGKHTQALDFFKRAIALDGHRAEGYTARAGCLMKLGRIAEALQDNTSAIALEPQQPQYLKNRALALYAAGEGERAFEDINRALALDKNFAEGWFNRGNFYLHQNKPLKAIEDYTRALSCTPPFDDAFYNRCMAYEMVGRTDKIISDCNTRISRKKDARIFEIRGSANFAQGKFSAAVSDYRQALAQGSTTVQLFYNIALSLDTLQQSAEARGFYERFVHAASPTTEGYQHAQRRMAKLSAR